VDSFQDALLMSLERAKEVAPDMGRKGVAEHRGVVKAIAAGDCSKAQEIMTAHLGRTAERLGIDMQPAAKD
jgi:GntR family transcriptional repressor for pyruvate dehydrogenase complex